MVAIECQELKKHFSASGGRIVAVDSINLSVSEGNFVTLVGPSGCGKTTLLRMIAGLETPTRGKIAFDDRDITSVRTQDRNISMVFQNIALFPFKTVRENIDYGLKYQDDLSDDGLNVEDIADMLGISDYLGQKPNQLSGGQQQRVAFARALVREPDVFLLDEPMSDLDAQLKIQLRSDIKELHQRFQRTTIYVTHDQEEAMSLSDQVVVMNEGGIEQKSPPHLVYQEPNNLFVARFIGSPTINTFDATLDANSISTPDISIELDRNTSKSLKAEATSEDVILGIRPQALKPLEKPVSEIEEGMQTLSATVHIYEQMGDEIFVHLKNGDQEVRAVLPTVQPPTPGEEMVLKYNLDDVYLFDGDTEELISHGLAPITAKLNK